MKDTTAVILCGGKGERLRPFTEHAPKPLLPLNGKPILQHLLEYLRRFGVERFVLCTGYKAEMIEQFVAETFDSSWDISCVNSGDATMTKRIRDAWPKVGTRALVCYGDTLANVDVSRLMRRHNQCGGAATVTLYKLQSPFGIVKFDRTSRVRTFLEKPQLPHWINIGFLMCEKTAVDGPLHEAEDMVEFLERLTNDGQLFVYKHSGKHLTINTEKERQQAENEMVEFLSVLDS